jgi:hypothetical protein
MYDAEAFRESESTMHTTSSGDNAVPTTALVSAVWAVAAWR